MIIPRLQELPGESKVPLILALTIIPQAIAFLFILARIILKVYILKTWRWDDTLIIFAWLNSLAMTVGTAVSTLYGKGHHMKDIPEDMVSKVFLICYITYICYQFCLSFTKISILVFYLQIFPLRREVLMTWGTIIFVSAYSVPMFVASILQCSPAASAIYVGSNLKCFEYIPFAQASAVMHTVSDAWLIAMIIPVLLTLRIPRREKYALIGVLSLGVFVIVASITRISTLIQHMDDPDVTWVMIQFDVWSIVESSVGIMCACAPMARPLLRKLFPGFMSSNTGGMNERVVTASGFQRTLNGMRSNGGMAELTRPGDATKSNAAKCRERNHSISTHSDREQDIFSTEIGIVKSAESTGSGSTCQVTDGGKGGSTQA